jgi:hypothetical protein
MKVYQLKHHKVFINEAFFNEERFIKQYRVLLEEQLRFHTISSKRLFQVINIGTATITSKPLITAALLRKQHLPAFQFLACKN